MMRNIFNPGTYAQSVNFALLLLRVSAGALMLTHGIGKVGKLFGSEPIQFADPIGLGVTASLALTVFAEVFCAFLIILGIGTRFGAITLFVTMIVAALIFHANDPFGKQELPLLYATMYFVIFLTGAGKYSADNWLYSKINK